MTPSERRWKWVKREAMPEDLIKLLDQLANKKQKKQKEKADDQNPDAGANAQETAGDAEPTVDFMT